MAGLVPAISIRRARLCRSKATDLTFAAARRIALTRKLRHAQPFGIWGFKMRSVVFACAVSAVLAGCAKDASQVGATYISPVTYESYTCPQLGEEAQRVSSRAAQASGVQDQRATNDKVAMGVGLIVFWPALLMTKGNDENTAELARLKGQMDAIEQASIKKKCGITFTRPAPQKPPEPQAQTY